MPCASLLLAALLCPKPCRADDAPETQAEEVSGEPLAPASRSTRPIPTATYWLGGAALGSFITAGALLASALSLRAEARETCAPGCPSQRRQIDRTLLTADVVGVGGGLLAVLALYSYLSRPTLVVSPAPVSAARLGPEWLNVRSVRSGAVAEVGVSF